MNNTINTASSTRTDPLSILHYQYNHLSAERLRNLCKCYKFPGISNLHVKSFNHIKECEYCKSAKSTGSSFTKTVPRCADVGHQWYVDVKGL